MATIQRAYNTLVLHPSSDEIDGSDVFSDSDFVMHRWLDSDTKPLQDYIVDNNWFEDEPIEKNGNFIYFYYFLFFIYYFLFIIFNFL